MEEEVPSSPPKSGASTPMSDDSYGPIPGSPKDEDKLHESKPMVCRWEGCDKELPSMETIVSHIQDEHLGVRKSKYACEWDGCSRKGIVQPSRFALVSHMRSHTGEKPFYCVVPECSSKFTRSDALAKHMRTVHETESAKSPKEELYVEGGGSVQQYKDHHEATERENEEESDTEEFSRLKRKLVWSMEMKQGLTSQLEELKRQRSREWTAKERLMDQLLESNIGEDAQQLKLVNSE